MAPRPDVAEMRSGFDDLLGSQLPESRDEMVSEFNKVVEKFEGAWWKQGLLQRWAMRRAIDEIHDHVEKVLEVVDQALDHHVPVLSLFETSVQWTDEVMTPVSDIQADIPPGVGNRDLARWDDSVRKVYDDIVSEQHGAAEAATELAAYMSRWLSDIGRNNVEFATHLVREIGGIIGSLVQAAAEAASVVGSPFALQDIAAAIGGMVETLFNTLAQIADDVTAAVDRVIDADNELSNHAHFPEGEWPKAVARA